MTVLHYTGYTHAQGGIATVIRSLQQAGRFEVVHGVSPGGEADSEGLACWVGPAIAGEEISARNFWRAHAVARAVQGWLVAEPGRVFHAHSRAGLLVALWLHWLGERRVVVSVHCYGRQRWFYRWAARIFGDRIFWLTPAMRRYYGVAGSGWEQCLPGGVKVEALPLRPPGLVAGRLRLGGAGFLVPWKRWDLVVEAIALLPGELRERVSFEHIGGTDASAPDYAAFLRELAVRHGLEKTVHWRGAEASSERLLRDVDAVVVPSRCEPYSMILQEALAAGLPVLAADSGGPPDVIQPGVNGVLFRDGDARALADLLAGWLRQFPPFDAAAIQRTARPAEDVAARWADIYAAL
jgi:glycosyltransferase involved in cell wall biosynthesis